MKYLKTILTILVSLALIGAAQAEEKSNKEKYAEKVKKMENNDITKRLSKSKLLKFKQCPKLYWFEQHFPQEIKPSPQMQRGTDLHDLFEEFDLFDL